MFMVSMKKSSNSGVAFVPTSSSIPPILLQQVDDKDLINYKEVGVEFQRYSKIKTSQNQYKLLRQESEQKQTIFSWAASAGDLSLSINTNFQTKTFYINNLIISGYSNLDTIFLFYDTQGKVIFLDMIKKEVFNDKIVEFKVPLKFDTQTIIVAPLSWGGVSQAITGTLTLNWIGYLEDKA